MTPHPRADTPHLPPALILVRAFVGAIALGACLVGCGDNGVLPVDAALARKSVRAALDAWQKGEPITALAKQSPPIVVQDLDWEFGKTLVRFTVLDEVKDGSVNLRVPVELTLRDKTGPEVRKKVTYMVGTSPTITVFREIF